MLTSLQCCKLGVDNLDKFTMIMKNWSLSARIHCPQEGPLMNFFMKEKNIIDENDTRLNIASYFNVSHEL